MVNPRILSVFHTFDPLQWRRLSALKSIVKILMISISFLTSSSQGVFWFFHRLWRTRLWELVFWKEKILRKNRDILSYIFFSFHRLDFLFSPGLSLLFQLKISWEYFSTSKRISPWILGKVFQVNVYILLKKLNFLSVFIKIIFFYLFFPVLLLFPWEFQDQSKNC